MQSLTKKGPKTLLDFARQTGDKNKRERCNGFLLIKRNKGAFIF